MSARPTDREVQCLLAVAKYGRLNNAAVSLGISEHTLKNQLWSLRNKLDVQTNLQAYAILTHGVKLVTTTTIKLESTE
jgi:DNA-binding CsgD family transcriptional regulator